MSVLQMIERAERILERVGDREDEFFADVWVQDAVLRNLEVIGEAAKGISDDLRSRYPDVPWREAAGFRDVVVHAYDKVVPERVWLVVEEELPKLLRQLHEIAGEQGWS